jgi:WD40 repeat protein
MAALTHNGTVLLTAFGPTATPVQIGTLLGDAAQGKTYGLIREFAAATSGVMAIETEDRRLIVWNPASNAVDTYPAPAEVDRIAANLAVSNDGGTVLRSVGNKVEVWKRGSTSPVVHTVAPETEVVMGLQALGAGSAFAFTTFGKSAGVLNTDTGEAILGPIATQLGLAIASPDGKTMVDIHEDGRVGIVHANETEWKVLREPELGSDQTDNVDAGAATAAFSPDGSLLAIGLRNGAVEMWRKDGRRAFLLMQGHSASIAHIAFQPDGKLLATTAADGRLQLWEQGESEPVQSFELDAFAARAVGIPPGGREILVAQEESLFRYPVNPIVSAGVDEQTRMACARLQERGITSLSDRDYVQYTFLEKVAPNPCETLGIAPKAPAAK